ncbi:prepilin-type N-terminal cleavage/methylation domain-containing protein [Gaetbulibacter sp. M235]
MFHLVQVIQHHRGFTLIELLI